MHCQAASGDGWCSRDAGAQGSRGSGLGCLGFRGARFRVLGFLFQGSGVQG